MPPVISAFPNALMKTIRPTVYPTRSEDRPPNQVEVKSRLSVNVDVREPHAIALMCDCPAQDGARSAQAGVDLIECRGARAELLFAQAIERRVDRIQARMHVVRIGIHVDQARD